MNGTKLAIRFALSPTGAAIDRFCVRCFGHSPVVWLFTRSDEAAYNRPLLLTTIGRKSGQPRSVVLPYFELGGGEVAIVGSRGGMPTDPHWAHNLRAHAEAEVHMRRRRRRVRTREVTGDERERIWPELVARSPVYADYQERARAHRLIPVFLVEPVDAPLP
jgi:deazaflavin-dependent oxidoreductase (nitroreductase family)